MNFAPTVSAQIINALARLSRTSGSANPDVSRYAVRRPVRKYSCFLPQAPEAATTLLAREGHAVKGQASINPAYCSPLASSLQSTHCQTPHNVKFRFWPLPRPEGRCHTRPVLTGHPCYATKPQTPTALRYNWSARPYGRRLGTRSQRVSFSIPVGPCEPDERSSTITFGRDGANPEQLQLTLQAGRVPAANSALWIYMCGNSAWVLCPAPSDVKMNARIGGFPRPGLRCEGTAH